MITQLQSLNPPLTRMLPLHVCSTSSRFNNASGIVIMEANNAIGGASWPLGNLAVYIPIHMPSRFTVSRFMVCSANTTGNVDVGLYDQSGNRLISTGTVAKNSATLMYFGVTDRSFSAGHYYLGLVCSTGGSIYRVAFDDQYEARMCGLLQEALGSTVLPATMTPVSFTSVACWCFGFTQSDSL